MPIACAILFLIGNFIKANKMGRKKSGRLTETKIYGVWEGMKERCYNKNSKHYYNYGGRGIMVCDEWKNDPCSFVSWALETGYKDGLSIDRIDNNKGYTPENCRWATRIQQQRNLRKTIKATINGVTKSYRDFCEELGISKKSIEHIVERHKVSYEEAFDLKLNYVYNPSKWIWEKKECAN